MVSTLFDSPAVAPAFGFAPVSTSWSPEPPRTGRRTTKIVVTAGPSCHTREQVRSVIEAGANVFRLNFSHADHAWHAQTLRTIRAVAAELAQPIAVMQDLCGPKIRVSYVAPGKSDVVEGQTISISSQWPAGSRADTQPTTDLAANYPTLAHDVAIGSRLLLDDGRVTLEIIEKQNGTLVARVVRGGAISVGKGINLPGVSLSAESMTAKDWQDLAWGVEQRVDFIALSFVRHPDDLVTVRNRLDQVGAHAQVIAKIERPEAIERICDILALADGLLIARGDLGLETDLARVPLLQKRLIEYCRQASKPVITATQMLESMVNDSTPTRAEVSDVANAIYDGSDAIMLAGETANGRHPAQAVEVLHAVALVTEADLASRAAQRFSAGKTTTSVAAVVEAAATAAIELSARRVVVYSQTGSTARLMARHRLPMPVVMVTNRAETYRQMNLCFGIEPLLRPDIVDMVGLLREMDELVLSRHWGEVDDTLVVVSALDGRDGNTDTLHIHRVRC